MLCYMVDARLVPPGVIDVYRTREEAPGLTVRVKGAVPFVGVIEISVH